MGHVIDQCGEIELNFELFESLINDAVLRIPETEGRFPVVAFISDVEMKRLNKMFRDKSATTDVLSFPSDDEEFEESGELGDLAISVGQASRQASENGLAIELEIRQLILHGILHLCGMDHETDNGEMNQRELALRKELGID